MRQQEAAATMETSTRSGMKNINLQCEICLKVSTFQSQADAVKAGWRSEVAFRNAGPQPVWWWCPACAAKE